MVPAVRQPAGNDAPDFLKRRRFDLLLQMYGFDIRLYVAFQFGQPHAKPPIAREQLLNFRLPFRRKFAIEVGQQFTVFGRIRF
jgi:hypothetical protein